MKFKLFLLASLLVYSCNNSDNEFISLYSFLPEDSSVIVNINNLNNTKEILDNNELLRSVLSSTHEISAQLNLLSKKKSDKNGILSLSSFGKDEIAFTYIRKSNSFDSIQEDDILKNTYLKSEIFLEETDGNEVHKVIIDEYIISSNKDIILENIIRDFYSKKSNLDSEFNKILNTTDFDEPFNIYTKSYNLNSFKKNLSEMSFFPKSKTSWVAYDFKNSLENLYLTGITRISDSINGKISILKNLGSSRTKTDKVIPNSFSTFLTFVINNSERFIFNFKDYLKFNDLSTENLNFNSLNIVDEISFVEDQEKFVILSLLNKEQIDSYFRLENFDDNYNIKKIDLSEDVNILFRNVDSEISGEYAVLLGDLLVITKSLSQIKKIINSQNINDNLGSNEKYLSFKEQKSDSYSFLWIGNNNSINSKIINDYHIDSKVFPYRSFSGRVNKNIALLEFNLSKAEIKTSDEDVYTEFFVTFDQEIISDPKWLKNHLNNEFDIAFQDSDNYLNYLSNKGNLNWKKKLSGKIIGDIKQVDIYKNGRKQMMFRTNEKLYLLDRNGNEVKQLSFPINSNFSNIPISIFDYEKNRNYRFLISVDNKINMYNSNGKIVSGFRPPIFESKIINNPVHIRINGKDYIVVQLEDGSLKILDRRGRDRVIVDNKIQYSGNSIYSYLEHFTTTDKLGNLIKIDTKGNLVKENINLSDENFIDIVDNNIVYLNENRLTIKGINVELPFSKFSKPKIFIDSNTTLVSITDLTNNEIYLYRDNGKLLKGFPIKGSSVIDIKDSDNDGKLEIISAIDNFSIVSYEINLSQN
tara:strand:+ start:5329 stop:7761 length:2433 start_codon:yes stop_codon:yes gene_type:complete